MIFLASSLSAPRGCQCAPPWVRPLSGIFQDLLIEDTTGTYVSHIRQPISDHCLSPASVSHSSLSCGNLLGLVISLSEVHTLPPKPALYTGSGTSRGTQTKVQKGKHPAYEVALALCPLPFRHTESLVPLEFSWAEVWLMACI